jgi:hypothetical protein
MRSSGGGGGFGSLAWLRRGVQSIAIGGGVAAGLESVTDFQLKASLLTVNKQSGGERKSWPLKMHADG